MTKRTSIFLSLSGETIYLSDRVLRQIRTASVDTFTLSRWDSRTVTAEGIRNVLLVGLEGVGSDLWSTLPLEKREAYLLWLMGCLDGLLLRMHYQETGILPEGAMAADRDDAPVH